jgi:hypothetical protein
LKLVRSGNTFTAYTSTNGLSWNLVGSATVDMTGTLMIGLELSSTSTSQPENAVFSNVSIT